MQAEPPWAAAGHLAVPQVLASGSTDGGTCPTSITLMPTPGMAQGGALWVPSPEKGVK